MSETKNNTTGTLGLFDRIELGLQEQRILHMTGIVAAPMYHETSARLRYMVNENHDPITIYLNTPGGSLLDGLGLYDLLKGVDRIAPLTIVAVGSCMSAGMFILQAASNRSSLPNTQFMIHELSGGGGGKLSDRKDDDAFAERLQSATDQIIAERSGMTISALKNLYLRKDFFLGAKEAKKLHLIDKIVQR